METERAEAITDLKPCSSVPEPGSTPDPAPQGQGPERKRGACDSTKTPDVEFDHALRLQMMTITGE